MSWQLPSLDRSCFQWKPTSSINPKEESPEAPEFCTHVAGEAAPDSRGAQPPGPHPAPWCSTGMARWGSGKPIGQAFLQNLIEGEGRLGSGPHLTRGPSRCS